MKHGKSNVMFLSEDFAFATLFFIDEKYSKDVFKNPLSLRSCFWVLQRVTNCQLSRHFTYTFPEKYSYGLLRLGQVDCFFLEKIVHEDSEEVKSDVMLGNDVIFCSFEFLKILFVCIHLLLLVDYVYLDTSIRTYFVGNGITCIHDLWWSNWGWIS